jgi:hypothetical protein
MIYRHPVAKRWRFQLFGWGFWLTKKKRKR